MSGKLILLSCIGACVLLAGSLQYFKQKRDTRISNACRGKVEGETRLHRKRGSRKSRGRMKNPRVKWTYGGGGPHPDLRSTHSLVAMQFLTEAGASDRATSVLPFVESENVDSASKPFPQGNIKVDIIPTALKTWGAVEAGGMSTQTNVSASIPNRIGGSHSGVIMVDSSVQTDEIAYQEILKSSKVNCGGGQGSDTWALIGDKAAGTFNGIACRDNSSYLSLPWHLSTERSGGQYPQDLAAYATDEAIQTEFPLYRDTPPLFLDLVHDVTRGAYMEHLNQLYYDHTLFDICLLGTHDSLTYDLSCNLSKHDLLPGTVASLGNLLLSHKTLHYLKNMGRSQVLTITEQFESGVRFFDIRASLKGDVWYSVHSFNTKKPLRVYLRELSNVVQKHLGEVCIVTLSRHGTQNLPSGTKLDELPRLDVLWKDVLDSLGNEMVDHTTHPIATTTVGEYVSINKRVLFYLDGWAKIAKGNPMGGKTSDLRHVGGMVHDVYDVNLNAKIVKSSFKRACIPGRDGPKFCYVGLNSANTTSAIIKAIFQSGSLMQKMISDIASKQLDKKLQQMGAHPATLLAFAQISLY